MSAPQTVRSYRALYLSAVVFWMGQSVAFAVFPMLGRELGLDALVLSIPALGIDFALKELAITSLSAVASLIFFLVTPFWGRRSDITGRKPMIILGLAAYSIGTLIFNGVAELGFIGALSGFGLYLVLVVARIFLVAMGGAIAPAASAYVADSTTAVTRTQGMGKLSAANQIGMMAGPVLAYFVFISFLAPLYLHAILSGITAILVWRFLPESKRPVSVEAKVSRLKYFDPRIRIYMVMSLIILTVLAMVQQTLGFYFQDRLNLDAVQATRYFSMGMLISSGMTLAGQLLVVQHWKQHPVKLLWVGIPLTMLGYFLIAYVPSVSGLIIGMALFGFGGSLSGPGAFVSATLVVEPDEQGALAGLQTSFAGAGFVIGPLLGGAIYGFNPGAVYWLAGLMLLPLLLLAVKHQVPQLQES